MTDQNNVLARHGVRARALRTSFRRSIPNTLNTIAWISDSIPRDAPFLCNQALEPDELASHGLLLPKSGPGFTATCRLFTEALIASANGRAIHTRAARRIMTRLRGGNMGQPTPINASWARQTSLSPTAFFARERALPGDHRLLLPRQSTLWVPQDLVAEFYEADEAEVNYYTVHEPIWLRDNDKQLVNYTDSARTKAWRRHLARWNAFPVDTKLVAAPKLLETDMHRVFNRSSLVAADGFYACSRMCRRKPEGKSSP